MTSAPGRARDEDDEGRARGALRRRDEARQGRVQLPERRRGGGDDDGRGAARERGRGVEQTNGTARNADAAVGLLVGIAFVAVSLLGLTCIGAVQTPSRFATAHPPSTKEF